MFLRTGFLLAVAMALLPAMAWGQTPVDRLPEGRQISGWSVEAIPVSKRRPSAQNITEFAGEAGIARLAIGPDRLLSSDFGQFGKHLVLNGRAFFRSKARQRYVFAFRAARLPTIFHDCTFSFAVGRKWLTSTSYNGNAQARSGEVATVSSVAAELEPGIYPLEFVFGCNSPAEAGVQFSVRDESDAVPRAFRDDELFYVAR
jgi:hypothetical protein